VLECWIGGFRVGRLGSDGGGDGDRFFLQKIIVGGVLVQDYLTWRCG
jgi:hypothetical protein